MKNVNKILKNTIIYNPKKTYQILKCPLLIAHYPSANRKQGQESTGAKTVCCLDFYSEFR